MLAALRDPKELMKSCTVTTVGSAGWGEDRSGRVRSVMMMAVMVMMMMMVVKMKVKITSIIFTTTTTTTTKEYKKNHATISHHCNGEKKSYVQWKKISDGEI